MGSIFKFSVKAKHSLVIDQEQISLNISVSDGKNFPCFPNEGSSDQEQEENSYDASINEHSPVTKND